MIDKEKLCQKISELFPEIGECGIDIKVFHDDKEKVWIVDLKKDKHELTHHLEYIGLLGIARCKICKDLNQFCGSLTSPGNGSKQYVK